MLILLRPPRSLSRNQLTLHRCGTLEASRTIELVIKVVATFFSSIFCRSGPHILSGWYLRHIDDIFVFCVPHSTSLHATKCGSVERFRLILEENTLLPSTHRWLLLTVKLEMPNVLDRSWIDRHELPVAAVVAYLV